MPTGGLSKIRFMILFRCLSLVSALKYVGPYVTFESVVVINSTIIIDVWSLLESIKLFVSRQKEYFSCYFISQVVDEVI